MQNIRLTCTSKTQQLSVDDVDFFIIKFDTVGESKSGFYSHLEIHGDQDKADKYKVGEVYYFFIKVE